MMRKTKKMKMRTSRRGVSRSPEDAKVAREEDTFPKILKEVVGVEATARVLRVVVVSTSPNAQIEAPTSSDQRRVAVAVVEAAEEARTEERSEESVRKEEEGEDTTS